jgi:hypothetical protein
VTQNQKPRTFIYGVYIFFLLEDMEKSRITGAKNWCEVCRTYTQPDAVSIRLHEQGGRHKSNARQVLRSKLEDERDNKRNNEELQRTIADMDREARAAMQKDRMNLYNKSDNQLNQNNDVISSSLQYREGKGDHIKVQEQEEEEEDGPKGLYSIRGVNYIMGEHARKELLSSGCACEVEIDGNWVKALIIGHPREIIIPNTLLTIRYYKLRLDEHEGLREMETRPSSIRVVISDEERDLLIAGYKRTEKEFKQQSLNKDEAKDTVNPVSSALINEDTGIGAWATVSVIEECQQNESSTNEPINLSKKRRRTDIESDPSKALDLEAVALQKKSFEAASALAPDDEDINAMDFINGSESYRGIRLGMDDTGQVNSTSVTKETGVAVIKPRKGPSGTIRRRQEDD